MKFGLEEATLEKIFGLFKKNPKIKIVLIYGSRAKGNFRKGSDIDLCIKESGFNLADLNNLQSQIDDLNLPYTFDLSSYESLTNPDFKDHIDRIGQIFYIQKK